MDTLRDFFPSGVTFSLKSKSDSIPNNGTGRVLVTDIGRNDDSALICRSENATSEEGDWFLHPTEMSTDRGDPKNDTDNGDRIVSHPHTHKGWDSIRANGSEGHQLVKLRKRSDNAEEGVFTCNIPGDDNTPRFVVVYYPSELH